MSKDTMIRASKKLSAILRHQALTLGLSIDGAGWVPLDELLDYTGWERAFLERIVADNNKSRFEIVGEQIRAVQGHSMGAVDLDVLEASWEVWTGEEPVWHGTRRAVEAVIRREGLTPQTRSHVHLAPSKTSVVGKRAGVEILLEVRPALVRAAGYRLYRAPNGVILARFIPPDAIGETISM